MAHIYNINGQTKAGKRLQNELRKRMSENLQRDQLAMEILKTSPKNMGNSQQNDSLNSDK